MNDWNTCEHKWEVETDSQSHSEHFVAVFCTRCWCPGEKDVRTNDVFWPAT